MADRVPSVPEATINLEWRALFNVEARRVHITIPILIIFNIATDFTSRHSVLAFTLPALLAFLQVQTAGTQPSPFHVHPVTTTASIIGVVGYYLSFGAQSRLSSYASQLSFLMSLLGSFSVASLASLLLPPSLWNFRFVFYVLLMLAEFLPWIKKIYGHWVRRRRQPMRRRGAQPCVLPRTSADLMD